jgi:hypothetical protein
LTQVVAEAPIVDAGTTGNEQRRLWAESFGNSLQERQLGIVRQKVQDEQAGCRVKLSLRRQVVDRTMHELNPLLHAQALDRGLRLREHVSGRVHPHETPAGVVGQEPLNLPPATGTDDQQVQIRLA